MDLNCFTHIKKKYFTMVSVKTQKYVKNTFLFQCQNLVKIRVILTVNCIIILAQAYNNSSLRYLI